MQERRGLAAFFFGEVVPLSGFRSTSFAWHGTWDCRAAKVAGGVVSGPYSARRPSQDAAP